MRKFKTYRKQKRQKLVVFLLFIGIFIILFIIISFQKMNDEYASFINYLLKDTSFSEKYEKRIITNNLTYLIPTISFKSKKELVYSKNLKIDSYSFQIQKNNLNISKEIVNIKDKALLAKN